MKRWNHLLMACCLAAATAACAGEREPDPNPTDPRQPGNTAGTAGRAGDPGYEATARDTARDEPGMRERAFVEDMLVDNRSEVELGQIAQKRAQNARVREFAGMMVKHHQQASAELNKVAAQAQIDAQVDADAGDIRSHRERLEGLSGAEFDREYMRLMVEKHEDAVEKVREHAEADNEHIRQWATKTLPVLQKHLEQARQIHGTIEKRATTE